MANPSKKTIGSKIKGSKSLRGIYRLWLADLKHNISNVRLQTSLQVNANMLLVYWYIGKQIQQKVEVEKWGAKVVEQLAKDLQKAFPDMRGLSLRNLHYMRRFASTFPMAEFVQQPAAQLQLTGKTGQQAVERVVKSNAKPIVQQAAAQLGLIEITQQLVAQFMQHPVAQIPWGHHMLLLDKTSSHEERHWYIEQTIKNGWSRNVLLYQIDSDLYKRQAKKKRNNNFHLTLPKGQSDLANQILKDPYNFEFLQIGADVSERELETQLTTHIEKFLLELGAGFAYVGRQFKLKLGRKEYFLDLLFYHLHLRCFVVIDLKMGEFEPEFAGKMNAYLNALNKEHRNEHDNASIGIILCNGKDEVEVEYSLQGLNHPIGVSEYKTMRTLPKNLRDKLPSAKQLEDAARNFLRAQKQLLAKRK